MQVGRVLSQARYTGHLDGDLADVALFNRVLGSGRGDADDSRAQAGPAGILAAQHRGPVARRGTWWSAGRCSHSAGGATVVAEDPIGDSPVIPMMGSGELYLDGVDVYASTASAVVATDGSFTVTARVRLSFPDDAARP